MGGHGSGNHRTLIHTAVAFAFGLGSMGFPGATAGAVLDAVTRDDEPITITGARLPDLTGRANADIYVFRWNGVDRRFDPVPFQIDERVNHDFNDVYGQEFQENIYDVFHEDDHHLDADDEMVFLFRDAGTQAPADTTWVPGADGTRFEIHVHDPRPDAPVADRWAYVFTGPSLPRATDSYVSWNELSLGNVSSSTWSVEWSDRWILDRLRIEPPCGTGADLIDRFKGRAGASLLNESEQEWNASSTYLGGLAGPIRAIRYVRGAASGVNTIHHDVVYDRFWQRVVNLRVHGLPAVALYFDLLPRTGTKVYTNRSTAGLVVDGNPDFAGSALVPWAVVSGPAGGYATLYDVPPSPFVGSARFYYRDDKTYNDATNPFYDDEDHSLYGAQGVELRDLNGTEVDAIYGSFRMYPLCSGVGDATTGEALQNLFDVPVTTSVVSQVPGVAPIRSLRLALAGDSVVLAWDAVAGATGYRIYAASDPSLSRPSWTSLGDVTTTNFEDAGARFTPDRYYSVVSLQPSGEGGW